MTRLDASTVLLQWATGGLAFLWTTTRHREVGPGYGWLLRGIYLALGVGGLVAGLMLDTIVVREIATVLLVVGAAVALAVSVRRRADFDPRLDLLAPAAGVIGLVAAGWSGGSSPVLTVARTLAGAAFLGAVSDAMLLGHWYLVQPGLPRRLLVDIVRSLTIVWLFEVSFLLIPTGMLSVFSGSIDDGWGGMLGWFWATCAVTTLALCFVTRAALKERQYSAVMAATGLLYLAILTAFGTDLVARAVLAG